MAVRTTFASSARAEAGVEAGYLARGQLPFDDSGGLWELGSNGVVHYPSRVDALPRGAGKRLGFLMWGLEVWVEPRPTSSVAS